jgi:hypothetical protein
MMDTSRGVLTQHNQQNTSINLKPLAGGKQAQSLLVHADTKISDLEKIVAQIRMQQQEANPLLVSSADKAACSRSKSRYKLTAAHSTLVDRIQVESRKESEQQRQRTALEQKNDRLRKQLAVQQQLDIELHTKTADALRHSSNHEDEYRSLLKTCTSNNSNIDSIKKKQDDNDVDRSKLQLYTKLTGVVLHPCESDDTQSGSTPSTPQPGHSTRDHVHMDNTNVFVGDEQLDGMVLGMGRLDTCDSVCAVIVQPFAFDSTAHSHAFIQRQLWKLIESCNSILNDEQQPDDQS